MTSFMTRSVYMPFYMHIYTYLHIYISLISPPIVF